MTSAHDMRTPLNSIMSMNTLLESKVKTEEGRKFLDISTYSCQMLLNYVNDMLDFQSIKLGKFKKLRAVFSLSTMLERIRSIFSLNDNVKNVEIRVEAHENIPAMVTADETRIQQVLLNLIGNACKFT